MKLLKQHDIKWVGPFISVLYLTAPLFGMAAYVMTAITMYTVIIPYVKPVVPWLTLPLFLLFMVVIVSIALVLFYKFIYPSYYAFQNRQSYIHNNPIQRDLKKIKEKLGITDEDDEVNKTLK